MREQHQHIKGRHLVLEPVSVLLCHSPLRSWPTVISHPYRSLLLFYFIIFYPSSHSCFFSSICKWHCAREIMFSFNFLFLRPTCVNTYATIYVISLSITHVFKNLYFSVSFQFDFIMSSSGSEGVIFLVDKCYKIFILTS